MSERKPGERPAHLKAPAHWPKSPPVPAPSPAAEAPKPGDKGGPDPTRYGDWEDKGIAIDF